MRMFPTSLSEAEEMEIGAACWSMDSGAEARLERTQTGFKAAAGYGPKIVLAVEWRRPDSSAPYELFSMEGPGAELLRRAGLDKGQADSRIFEYIGAMAMGAGKCVEIPWEEWRLLQALGSSAAEPPRSSISPQAAAPSRRP